MPPSRFAPLSIAPARTWIHLSRIVGYALVFLLVRQLARGRQGRLWVLIVPLLGLGAFEAVLGLVQHFTDAEQINGTYASKDHFSGLLEMILPMALMYGVAALERGKRQGVMTLTSVITAACAFGLAAVIFVDVAFSLSKMGFISMLGSLFVMGILSLGSKFSGAKRWIAVAGLGFLLLLVFVFLPPDQLVEQFAGVTSDVTAEGRIPIAKDTLHLIAAYPLFGSGLGTYFPALLPYQTSGLNVTWVNAHNDYLELLAALGFIGFAIPAVLIGSVFLLAVRTAIAGETRDIRFLGLACTGSMASLLIHSLADFNLFVPANAMVLSWIAAIPLGIPAMQERPRPSPLSPSFTKRVLFALGCLASLYAGGWLIFIHALNGNVRYEPAFCRFGICNSGAVLDSLTAQHGDDVAAVPPRQLQSLLVRDPAGAYNWADLGESLQKTGRTAEARACFARVVALAPHVPYMLYRAARFHFGLGENREALSLMSAALTSSPDFDDDAFEEYEQRKIGFQEILSHGMTPERQVWVSYLRRQFMKQRVPEALTVWKEIAARGYADDGLANDLVEFLIQRKQPESAVEAWSRYKAGKTKGYPEEEKVFNGDFESEPAPSRFDWRVDRIPGVAVDFDRETKHAGERSLRLRFDGTQDLTNSGVHQSVLLKPGRYIFRAWVRSREISTDEGVSFNVTSEGGPGPNFTTEPILGSTDWKLVERAFVAPAGTGLVRISLVRKQPLKFDNKLAGTLWIDQVSIRPER